MIFFGIIVSVVLTMLPGILLVRLLRKELHPLDVLLYAVGLGLFFNFLVGLVANFTGGITFSPVLRVYIGLCAMLLSVSLLWGKPLSWKWQGWKPAIIPLGLYLSAVGLQLQTTLMSPSLVGSDIHLEYFVSNIVLENGVWNPSYMGTTLNACLGLTLLLPVYKLLAGMTLMWVFKLVAPLIFAVLPVILYRIFKPQFGTVVAVLAVVFFVTMPMFTMDMVQLVRQQQATLFFVLVVLVVLDGGMPFIKKLILGVIFSIGAMVNHIGIAIGFTGYLWGAMVIAFVLAKIWKNKVDDARKPMMARFVLVGLAIASIGLYAGFYGAVYGGKMITSGNIPIEIMKKTVRGLAPATWDMPPSVGENVADAGDKGNWLLQRFPFLDPLSKEPLAQTAIGLDFYKASALGKVWRVLQYLVEICLVVGFLKLIFRPLRSLKIEYVAFVIASFLVLAGIYFLSTWGWGLGTPRVWGVTLLFISPLFVLGAETIGKWIFKGKNVLVGSTLVLLVPYFAFNSGIVFEVAKLQPAGFIDVPYSVALSGHRVDIGSVFTNEDVEAMDWLKERFLQDGQTIYTDTHGGNLMVQRIGTEVDSGQFKYLWQMKNSDTGYIFLRKWNVESQMVTLYRDYASRESHKFDDFSTMNDKIENGVVIFDNGAKVIKVTK